MLQSATLKFLAGLEKNNNKAWFEKNREVYEAAKADLNLLVENLIPAISVFDPTISALLAKNCTFRINRDVRFAKDKSPYKNNLAAYFNMAGKKGNGAGYYLHIQPGKSFVAAGIWQPPSPDLLKIRQEIDYNLEEWQTIINNKNFRKSFAKGFSPSNLLSRPPKGYTDDNPAIDYLKLKSFEIICPLTDEEVLEKSLLKKVAITFKSAHPLVKFLNRSLE